MRISWSTYNVQTLVTNVNHLGSNANATKEHIKHTDGLGAPKKTGKTDQRLKRARTLLRATKHESVTQAKKREKVKINVVKKATIESAYSFIYVGNLESSITQEHLHSIFSACGSILRIQIRCSRGQAVTTGVSVPEDVRTFRDRQYATVEFKDAKAAMYALRLNGTIVNGCRIMVTVSAAELPEVHDIIRTRLGDIRGRQGGSNAAASVKSVQSHDTVMFSETKPDRHRFLGVSFGMCVV